MENTATIQALHQPKTEHIIRKHKLWRILEIVPGVITWAGLLLPILLSYTAPELVAVFILIYTLIWLFRSIKLSVNIYRSYLHTLEAEKTDWRKLISYNDNPEKIDYELSRSNQELDPKNHFKLFYLKKQIQHLQAIKQWQKSKDIYHAIIFVTYKEPYEIIRQSVLSYTKAEFTSSKIILVLAGEESDKANFSNIAEKIKKEFGEKFQHLMITIHPNDIPGEIKGKSSNATWAAKLLKKYLDHQKIPYENVILSNFDADTIAHPFYFSELTFKYLTEENRIEKAYQPTHFYHNNIWEVPVLVRMVALISSFSHMSESVQKEKYKSFSSRSLSFKTVVDVDYWDPAVIPEDSRQYWTAYAVYDGRHILVPIYTPVYMDAVQAENYIKTFKNQYSQLRRWAYGVCDFPFVVLNLWYHPKLKLSDKINKIFEFLKDHFFWATGPILIMFTGYLPASINPAFRDSVLAYNLPQIMSSILTFASIGLIICTLVSLKLVPYNPKNGWLGHLSLCLQWVLIPIASIFLSAIPALDAQTRLMFGRYLEYKVTEKVRK